MPGFDCIFCLIYVKLDWKIGGGAIIRGWGGGIKTGVYDIFPGRKSFIRVM